jgi:hypothetical protein
VLGVKALYWLNGPKGVTIVGIGLAAIVFSLFHLAIGGIPGFAYRSFATSSRQ